jgi:hypothetical protein
MLDHSRACLNNIAPSASPRWRFSRAATFGDFLGRYHEKFIRIPANLVVRYLNAGTAPSARHAGRMREIREYSICRSAMGIDPRIRRIGDIF